MHIFLLQYGCWILDTNDDKSYGNISLHAFLENPI